MASRAEWLTAALIMFVIWVIVIVVKTSDEPDGNVLITSETADIGSAAGIVDVIEYDGAMESIGSSDTVFSDGVTRVGRIVDDEAGVVCWVHKRPAGGISCLPIEQTRLDR